MLGLNKLDLHEVDDALGRARVGRLMVTVILMVATFLARGQPWFTALRVAPPDPQLPRITGNTGLLIGMAGSTVAPGAGEAARALLIARRVSAMSDRRRDGGQTA